MLFYTSMERWQSGRMYHLGKVAEEQSSRGFESLSLRIASTSRILPASAGNNVDMWDSKDGLKLCIEQS